MEKPLYKCMLLVPEDRMLNEAKDEKKTGTAISVGRDVRGSRISNVDVDIGPGATVIVPQKCEREGPRSGGARSGGSDRRKNCQTSEVRFGDGDGFNEKVPQRSTLRCRNKSKRNPLGDVSSQSYHNINAQDPERARKRAARHWSSFERGSKNYTKDDGKQQSTLSRGKLAAFSPSLAKAGVPATGISLKPSLRQREKRRLDELVSARLSTLQGKKRRKIGGDIEDNELPANVSLVRHRITNENPTPLEASRQIIHELRDVYKNELRQQAAQLGSDTSRSRLESEETSSRQAEHPNISKARTVSALSEEPQAVSTPKDKEPPSQHNVIQSVGTSRAARSSAPETTHVPRSQGVFAQETPRVPQTARTQPLSAKKSSAQKRPASTQEAQQAPPKKDRPRTVSLPVLPPPTSTQEIRNEQVRETVSRQEVVPPAYVPVRTVERARKRIHEHDEEGQPFPTRVRQARSPPPRIAGRRRTFQQVGGPSWDWMQRQEDPELAPPDPQYYNKRSRLAWAEDYDDNDNTEYDYYDDEPLPHPPSPAQRFAGKKRAHDLDLDSEEEEYLWALPPRNKRRGVYVPMLPPAPPSPVNHHFAGYKRPPDEFIDSEDEMYPELLPPRTKKRGVNT